MTKIQIPEDGWVEIAKLAGEDADDQVEENEGWSNDGESVTADVLMEDGKPVRLSVSNSNYNGDFAETAFATYFPKFELLDSGGWDVGGPGEDVVVCSVKEK